MKQNYSFSFFFTSTRFAFFFLTLKSPSPSACQCSQNTVGRYSVNPKHTLLPCKRHPSSLPLQHQSSPVSACTRRSLEKVTCMTPIFSYLPWSPRSDSWSYQIHLPGAVLSSGLRQSQRLTRDSNQPSGVCQLECLVRLHGMQAEMCSGSGSSMSSSLPVGQQNIELLKLWKAGKAEEENLKI